MTAHAMTMTALHVQPGELQVWGIKGEPGALLFAIQVLSDDGTDVYSVKQDRAAVRTLVEHLNAWLADARA